MSPASSAAAGQPDPRRRCLHGHHLAGHRPDQVQVVAAALEQVAAARAHVGEPRPALRRPDAGPGQQPDLLAGEQARQPSRAGRARATGTRPRRPRSPRTRPPRSQPHPQQSARSASPGRPAARNPDAATAGSRWARGGVHTNSAPRSSRSSMSRQSAYVRAPVPSASAAARPGSVSHTAASSTPAASASTSPVLPRDPARADDPYPDSAHVRLSSRGTANGSPGAAHPPRTGRT